MSEQEHPQKGGKIIAFPQPAPAAEERGARAAARSMLPAGLAALVSARSAGEANGPNSPSSRRRRIFRPVARDAEAGPTELQPNLPLDPRRLLEADPGDLTPAELVLWLESLRRGGLASIYWNAGKIALEASILRASRLQDEAIIQLSGQRVLVVEPIHRPARRPTGQGDVLAE